MYRQLQAVRIKALSKGARPVYFTKLSEKSNGGNAFGEAGCNLFRAYYVRMKENTAKYSTSGRLFG